MLRWTVVVFGAWCSQAFGQGIYTCVDAKGRRLTSDRPILECIDREQKELSSSGITRRRIGPSLTADEQALEDEKARKIQAEQFRINEEKRRDRALLSRYPNKTVHDKERAIALTQIDDVMATAKLGAVELSEQRKSLEAELEFYKNDPTKIPPRLKRSLEENANNQATQKRFVDGQIAEKKRINDRFDEELARLKVLWAQLATPATRVAPAPSGAPVPLPNS
ncbi:MAG: DUF4124 domain-containing protein, partial [Burkholderiales bacterium]